jgi:hypothetical protein
MLDGSRAKNPIEKKAWKDCKTAAKKAEKMNLKDINQFSLRQGPLVEGQHDSHKPGFQPDWAVGRQRISFGPFQNVGGGDVPKGADTWIDFWKTDKKK